MKHIDHKGKTMKTPLTILGILTLIASAGFGQEISDEWRYTLRRPAEGWRQPKFDDADWTTGFGGFGTRETPGARVGTTWATNGIWLRKSFELNSVPEKPALLVHHDEDAVITINGMPVAVCRILRRTTLSCR